MDNDVGSLIQNVKKAAKSVYIGMAFSIVWCILFIYLMSAYAEQISWAVIILTQIGLFAVGGICIMQYQASTKLALTDKNAKPNNTMLGCGILALIVGAIMFCLVYCAYKSLKIAIDVIDASADFTKKTKRIICVSIGYFVLQMLTFFIWLFSVVSLWSWGDIRVDSIPYQTKETFFPPGQKNNVYYALYFLIFGIWWILTFYSAKVNFITMFSASTYYFDSSPSKGEGDSNVSAAFKATYFYHAGSLALGSFILTVVQILEYTVMVACEHAIKQSGDNMMVKCVLRCAECCMACIEKLVDSISRSAYAYMAVTGQSFCSSAFSSLLLNLKHGLAFAFAMGLAEGFILIGKILITMSNMLFVYVLMKYGFKDMEGEDAVTSCAGPLGIVAVVTYLATSVFLGLFDETVLALMTCLCIDTDMNGDSPKFGPPTFHEACDFIKNGEEGKKVSDAPATEMA